jgi:hypothetical protein
MAHPTRQSRTVVETHELLSEDVVLAVLVNKELRSAEDFVSFPSSLF